MRDRITQLRQETLEAIPRISAERSLLLLESYESQESKEASVPVQRALAFKHIMSSKELYVGDNELIVGERGPAPAAVPTYPEICVHSRQDLEILDTRDQISYKVDAETKKLHCEQVLPFWQGRAQRDRLFREMSPEWIDAYEAGMFTEFQEQRTPGHTALGDKIFRKGFLDVKNDIRASLDAIDYINDPEALDKREELTAMDIAADAIMIYANRYAEKLTDLAASETNPKRKSELETMANNCRNVPANAPETFWEALQCYWFVHVCVITELNPWDSFNPGRLDQHLWPFYENEVVGGDLDQEDARELLQAFWVKFHNHPAPPKVGVTAKESGTYTDFSLINLGGLKADGTDGVNDLTFLILDVIEEMRLLQPSAMCQLSKKNPDSFMKRAGKIIKTGFGQPSIFNTDAIVKELTRQGKSLEDARCGGASGCVESGAFGKEAYFLSGYFNIPKVLEITLNNGVDPKTGKTIGIATGDPCQFQSFDEFYAAFEKQLEYFVNIKITGNNIIEKLYAKYMPVPFLSLIIEDCVENAKDYHSGGARYNTTYIQGVGLGSITDMLSSIAHNVYETKRCTMDALLSAMKDNYQGHEKLHSMLVHDTPKYGNDDDRADALTRRLFQSYFSLVDGKPNTRGGKHRINMLPTTVHVYFGSMTGAMPDGKLDGETLSEGISPVQGADHRGPTAALNSAAKIDHIKTGGTLLNQKMTPELLSDEGGLNRLVHLVRGYFAKDTHHIQFNVVTRDLLLKAQKEPEKHRDLIVRVAGYSDYFGNLTKELQDEIIKRTEHLSF